MRTAGVGALAALAVLLLVVSPAGAQSTGSRALPDGLGIRLLEAPVDRTGDPRATVYIVDHLAPGQTVHRRIEVSNGTGMSGRVRLYPAAAEVDDERGFHLADDESSGEVVDWARVTPTELRLADGEVGTASVTIAVPAGASPGERYGAVLAELPGDPDGGVAITARVGIRLYLSIGAGGEPVTDFVIEELTAARDGEGLPTVRARVRNTGGRAVDLAGELTLSEGPGGIRAGPFPAELGTTIAPGDHAPMTVVLDADLPAGPWTARMVARSGTVERAAEATISFPRAAGGQAGPVGATPVPPDGERDLPFLLRTGVIALLLLGLTLWWLLGRRRDRDRPSGDTAEERVRVPA